MRGVRLVSVAFVAMLGLVVGAPLAAQAGSAPVLGWTPQTSSSPSTFNFMAVSASGTSQTFTLKNSGGSATSALKISLSPSSSGFSIAQNHCTMLSIGPKKTCTVQINYTPTGAASDTATLTAMSKKPAATGQIILQGTLATPNVQIVPDGGSSPISPYDFGAQGPGSGVGRAFTATNVGTAATGTYTFTGPSDAAFSVAQSSAPCDGSPLGVGASCSFTVFYTGPADCGTATGFSDTISLGSYASQAVQGECVLAISMTPDNFRFGESSPTQSFTVTNTGNETGTLAAPTVTGRGFSIGSGNTCTGGLAPAATCSVPVTYSPATCEYTGEDLGTLTAGISLGSTQTSAKAGLGGIPPTQCITLTPPFFTFNTAGQSQLFTVTNSGPETADLSLKPFFPENSLFGLGSSGTCGTSLASGASCTYEVDASTTAPCGTVATTDFIVFAQGETSNGKNQFSSNLEIKTPACP
jgi:hypothetical protein